MAAPELDLDELEVRIVGGSYEESTFLTRQLIARLRAAEERAKKLEAALDHVRHNARWAP